VLIVLTAAVHTELSAFALSHKVNNASLCCLISQLTHPFTAYGEHQDDSATEKMGSQYHAPYRGIVDGQYVH
jgi:hypothetical protein